MRSLTGVAYTDSFWTDLFLRTFSTDALPRSFATDSITRARIVSADSFVPVFC